MKLYAISDLHVANRANQQALEALPSHPGDWLLLAGDIGETDQHLEFALSVLTRRFERLVWVPGNHDLWSLPVNHTTPRGNSRYMQMVSLCRNYGVLTPEDPYETFPGGGGKYVIAPLFVLYDYSYRPDHVPLEEAVEWAADSGILCTDEDLLHPDPFASIPEWCAQRCRITEERLAGAAARMEEDASLILVNHYPLRQDLVYLYTIRRFSIWCGTRCTEDWHTRFPVSTVVYGHLHNRGTHFRDGVRFEEVSLGYPRDWRQELGAGYYLREILPGKGGNDPRNSRS